MSEQAIHNFGVVDEKGDLFLLHFGRNEKEGCFLEEVRQTERGPRRVEIATISSSCWDVVAARVIRELINGMGDAEKGKKTPTLMTGTTRFSPFLGRELAVLFWALMEEGAKERVEAILHGWRELAREERWWLFSRASGPGQRAGKGWRRALYHALAEAADSRSSREPAEKKSPKSRLPEAFPVNRDGVFALKTTQEQTETSASKSGQQQSAVHIPGSPEEKHDEKSEGKKGRKRKEKNLNAQTKLFDF